MIDLPANERSPEAVRPPEVVARNDTVIDPFSGYLFSRCHVTLLRRSIFTSAYFLLIFPLLARPSSPDHFLGPHEHHRWNRQAKCLGGFKVDHQLELSRLLDREVRRLRSVQNLDDHHSSALIRFDP